MKKFQLKFSNPYIRTRFFLCFIVAILATIIGAVTSLAFQKPILAITALLFVAYFVVEACEIVADDRAGKYVVVHAVMKDKNPARMISGLQNKSIGSRAFAYRFSPVDENGELLDATGKQDIFLTFTEKQSSMYGLGFEGRVHNLVFCKKEGQPFDLSTLRGIYCD